MHTTDTIPRSPSSHTAALWPTDPAPAYWPTVANVAPVPPAVERSRALAATRRALADEALVRRMVAECAAMCPMDGEVRA
jgi:hypothetical protein